MSNTTTMSNVAAATVCLRAAAREDAAAIARLFLVASDGLAAYIWRQAAAPGQTVEAAGAARYARRGVAFSYENCLVAERSSAMGGRVIGMAHSFVMEAGDGEPEQDPVLRPYSELEDIGSLYLSGLAVDGSERGLGLGTRLLARTEARARALGCPRVSLICFEENRDAMRLYLRQGYAELDRRPLVPHPCLHYTTGDAVLLAKAVG